ncbi:MAG: GNAT family N-acetyltransferase [archaeon]
MKSQDSIKIRKAKKTDFEGYYQLENEFSKYCSSLEKKKDFHYKIIKKELKKNFLEKIKKKNKIFIFIEEKGALQGYLFGEITKGVGLGYSSGLKKVGYLENIFISSSFRKKGYGSKLLEEFNNFLKKNKVKYLFLHVECANQGALKFYNKLSFKIQEYKMYAKI